jgi:hypothetical protein
LLHKLVFAEARFPYHKQVESLLLNIDTEFNGFQRPTLTQRLIQGLEICRSFKFKLSQIAGLVEFRVV